MFKDAFFAGPRRLYKNPEKQKNIYYLYKGLKKKIFGDMRALALRNQLLLMDSTSLAVKLNLSLAISVK